MKGRRTVRLQRPTKLALLAAAAGLMLAGCGGGNIESTGTQAAGECDDELNMAINPWVGYEASAHVVGYIAKQKLGCEVEYKPLKEELAWQGFGSGEVDVVIENWGHADLKNKYIQGQETAVRVGPTGNTGIIGWYVPPWLAEAHPDVLHWQNLNKYADEFATSESAPKGQLLDGDPSFVTNDEALVENLNLNFKVVYAGSEPALIQAFRQAEKNHDWLIGYFYEPQWLFQDLKLEQVQLPPYKPGCDANPEQVDCEYPTYNLDKIASKEFMQSGSPAAKLVDNFKWTNADQNTVAGYIAEDGMSPEAAAEKWVKQNPEKVQDWIPAE
jgi:glycine betaine/proline transport system substrate-binding protein